MAVKIRVARTTDLAQVAKIFREEFRKSPYNEKWDAHAAKRKIREYFDNHKMLVALTAGTILGFVVFDFDFFLAKKVGCIKEIVVSAQYQGKGLGRILLAKAEGKLRKGGAKFVYFVAKTNAKAFKIYVKAGYKEMGLVLMSKGL